MMEKRNGNAPLMGDRRKRKRVSNETDITNDENWNVVTSKDEETMKECIGSSASDQHMTALSPSYCGEMKEDLLSKLDTNILGFILSFLENEDLTNLSLVNKRLRRVVQSMFFLSFKTPMSPEDLEGIRQNPYSHNKPVLRLSLTNPRPNINVTKQLLVLNLGRVSEVFIKFEYDKNRDVQEFRIALVALLQILVDFKRVKKLHFHVYPEFFINPSRVYGRKLMGAMTSVPNIEIALLQHSKMEKKLRKTTLFSIEEFLTALKCKTLTFRGSTFFDISHKKFKFENNFTKDLFLQCPCLWHPRLSLGVLESLSVNCLDGCPGPNSHLTDCVVTWKQAKDGCPLLKHYKGTSVEEVKSQREEGSGRRKSKTVPPPESHLRPVAVSPPRVSAKSPSTSPRDTAVSSPTPHKLVYAKKSKPKIESPPEVNPECVITNHLPTDSGLSKEKKADPDPRKSKPKKGKKNRMRRTR